TEAGAAGISSATPAPCASDPAGIRTRVCTVRGRLLQRALGGRRAVGAAGEFLADGGERAALAPVDAGAVPGLGGDVAEGLAGAVHAFAAAVVVLGDGDAEDVERGGGLGGGRVGVAALGHVRHRPAVLL